MNKESGRLMASRCPIMESCEGLIKNLDFTLKFSGREFKIQFPF